MWYCWKATAEWNNKVQSVLEKRRIRTEKMAMKIFNF